MYNLKRFIICADNFGFVAYPRGPDLSNSIFAYYLKISCFFTEIVVV